MGVSGRSCPVCGTELERYVPIAYHCPECGRDYWQEGEYTRTWWTCDESGEPERVEVATDGAGEIRGHDIEWRDTFGDYVGVMVEPEKGTITVNDRVFEVSALLSDDVDPGMYRQLNPSNFREDA